MSCNDTARLLDAYADGELDLAASLTVEDHLESCARCKADYARMRALRGALRRNVGIEPAPERLRERLAARFAHRARARVGWGWMLAAAPGIAALLLVLWLGFAPAPEARVVYHMASSAQVGAALRTLGNHLNAAPGTKVVVVAHNEGIDFLLRGARDENGQTLEPVVGDFRARGVEFRVCGNTLERRRIDVREVIPAAALVPSGIAEIGRLQREEHYIYMRL